MSILERIKASLGIVSPSESIAPTEVVKRPPATVTVTETNEVTVSARSREFVGRYEPMLSSASVTVLQRIHVEGAPILPEMSDEIVVAANVLADATNSLAAAIEDPAVPAYTIHAREKEIRPLELDHARKLEAYEMLSAFLERVETLIGERE